MHQCCIKIMKITHKTIQDLGGRLTKIKQAILDILSMHHCLLSKRELVEKLKAKKIKPDRSTIYRELQFLSNNGIIIKNTISDIDYYEIPKDHHHHLVCLNCNSISKVEMGNHLEKQEKLIAKQNKFNIINHSLEFYGYCHKCKS
jgi:Fur family transcriptional regulator, ferric uptake regulator